MEERKLGEGEEFIRAAGAGYDEAVELGQGCLRFVVEQIEQVVLVEDVQGGSARLPCRQDVPSESPVDLTRVHPDHLNRGCRASCYQQRQCQEQEQEGSA